MVHSDAVSDMYQVVTIVKDDRWGRLVSLFLESCVNRACNHFA